MKKELTTYRCAICGNLICMLEDSGAVPVCCGKEMTLIKANIEDADTEKHVPVSRREGVNVRILVGTAPHPMTSLHHIDFILLLTDKGAYMRDLSGTDRAEALFCVGLDEKIIAAYALCNIHGLWKS